MSVVPLCRKCQKPLNRVEFIADNTHVEGKYYVTDTGEVFTERQQIYPGMGLGVEDIGTVNCVHCYTPVPEELRNIVRREVLSGD